MLRAFPRSPGEAIVTSQAISSVTAAEPPRPKRTRLSPAPHTVGMLTRRTIAAVATALPMTATRR